MNQEHRADLRARGQAFVRHFVGVAEGTGDLVGALYQVLTPDARVHLQNGEVVQEPQVSRQHTDLAAAAFPNLEMELQEVLFPDDRVVARVRMLGSTSRSVPFAPAGFRIDVEGAFIARVTEDLRLSEMRPYLNPGFAYSFPPTGARCPVPEPDGAGEEAARALYASWVHQAEAGYDFVEAISRSLAADGAVHLGNGDMGGGALLAGLFERIAQALHELTLEIEDVMFDGPYVVAPFRMSGVHRGSIGFYQPTGRVLTSTGCVIARASRRGKAAEVWIYVAPAYALTFPPGRVPPIQ